tara:strand:- start:20950 stop:22374 length:1425 start_codon:yes stop_codon:yes gene_type:complete
MIKYFVKHFLLAIVLVGLFPIQVQAQYLYSNPEFASTYDWTVNHRLQILDKSHADGDFSYDRGFSRVLAPKVKREYELDMMEQEFSFGDQFEWYDGGRNGFRSRFASYSKTTWAVYSELHATSSLTGKSRINLHTYLQQHARANRALFELQYQLDIKKNQKISIQNTLSEFKKDIDFTVSYEFNKTKVGNFQLDITYQDYLNNIVNGAGNDSNPLNPQSRQIQKEYNTTNFLFSGRWYSNKTKWYHWDISYIYQPKVKSNIIDKTVLDFGYKETENLYLMNGAISARVKTFIVGVYGYKDFNALRRYNNDESVTTGYKAKQSSLKGGGFLYGRIWRLEPKLRISRERYTDVQAGNNFENSIINKEFNYGEYRWLTDIGLGLIFSKKVKLTVRYMKQKRDIDSHKTSDYLTRNWTREWFFVRTKDHRMAFHLTINTHKKLKFELFGAYDIDGDSSRTNPRVQRFDKGGGKLIVLL